MRVTQIDSPGSRSLAELEEFIDEEEDLLGHPLVDLGSTDTDTVLTFNLDEPRPASFVALQLNPGGGSPVPAGFTRVCQGNCMVAGQLAGVMALRSTGAKPAVPAVNPGTALSAHLTTEQTAAEGFKPLIVASARKFGLPPSIVAGIGSQESGWGTSPLMHPRGPAGTGDAAHRSPNPPSRPGALPPDGFGFGRGLMQIDWDFHDFARTGNWRDPAANIDFGCSLLAGFLRQAQTTLHLAGTDAMTVAVAAYNAGFGGASKHLRDNGLASLTAPGQYAAKVLARAAFYAANGFVP